MVSELEAERLYRMKKYITDEELRWETRNNKLYLSATVLGEDGTELTLRATKHRNYSFCLLAKKTVAIRRFDFYFSHTNVDGTKLIGNVPHKHKWDGTGCHDAYEVYDIDVNDVNKALFDFFEECNIDFNGTYQTILAKKSE